MEPEMKAASLCWEEHGSGRPGAKLTPALPQAAKASTGLLARLDRWFWRQAQREREAYLAGAHDICDLEARIRRLERSGSSLYA